MLIFFEGKSVLIELLFSSEVRAMWIAPVGVQSCRVIIMLFLFSAPLPLHASGADATAHPDGVRASASQISTVSHDGGAFQSGLIMHQLSAATSMDIQDDQRCKATTKKGTQCKRNAKAGSEFCWQHQKIPDAKRCKANTKAGKRCSRKAQIGSEYCWQHDK
jgi:hypothetical protein